MGHSKRKCTFRFVSIVLLTLVFYSLRSQAVQAYSIDETVKVTADTAPAQSDIYGGRAVDAHSGDEYVVLHQQRCFNTRNLASCLKYKVAKAVWSLATNGMGYFAPEQQDFMTREDKRRIRFVHLNEPADIQVYDNEVRSLKDDNEFTRLMKFLKRAVETFGRNHGLQVSVSSESGARVTTGSEMETPRSRKDKKKRKWLIILPLVILMKIAHLKMTLVSLLFGVLGLNVLIVGGTAWLIHYLKFKTLCKIHPQLVQHHSHVYDSDPSDYSSFVGSSFPGSSYYSSSSTGSHDVGNAYNKDWASSKAYKGYNYLDTISKRLQ